MSHFSKIRTKFVDPNILQNALAALGFHSVEVNDKAVNLFGYRGDKRPDRAEVIIRRAHIGKLSNDIGFKLGPNGTFDAIISEFDQKEFGEVWLTKLTRKYAEIAIKTQLSEQGFHLVEESSDQCGSLHLVLRRSVY